MNPTPPPEIPEIDQPEIMESPPPYEGPDANDSWAQVELFRWQYGELPKMNDMRPLIPADGLRNMAQALEDGMKPDATPEGKAGRPDPFNVCSVMRYAAKLIETSTMLLTHMKNPNKARRSAVLEKAIGRNDPCPCGSGQKFKKCCFRP